MTEDEIRAVIKVALDEFYDMAHRRLCEAGVHCKPALDAAYDEALVTATDELAAYGCEPPAAPGAFLRRVTWKNRQMRESA